MGGTNFVFSSKIGFKNAKNRVFCILFWPMGGSSPPVPLAPILRGCELHELRNGGLQELQSCGLAIAD